MDSFITELELEIKLEEIKAATDNFNVNKVIGSGGFGKVYAGEVSHSKGRSMVAFKRLDRKYGQGDPEFFKEIRMLSCYRHENLISLLGFCNQGDEMILVYEYASRGSLDRILDDTSLTWTQRIKICLDAAKGLRFLHDPNGTHQRVLHCDIKSANILLDENLNAKVSDFGLSKISPANQLHTFLLTNTVGTIGYCDPLYMDTYSLTKESDVYSFGVVLFEVLCGRLCFENINGQIKVFVSLWKQSYEEKKLHEIVLECIKQQIDSDSLETFADVAYGCLKKSCKERPLMADVVKKLEIALESQELHDLKQQDKYEEMIKLADPPLIYTSVKELKALLSKGFLVNGGKTMFCINAKEQHCERVCIEGCLNPNEIKACSLKNPSHLDSRFPGGLYYSYQKEFKACPRAQFLSPLTEYTMNLVFRYEYEWEIKKFTFVRFKLDGETKISIVRNKDMSEDGWLMARLYKFTSKERIVDLEILFQECWFKLNVAGIEFQPIEENVESDQVLEYQEILKAASGPLVYRSVEELKVLFFKGVHLNGYNTWFSSNKNGEHSELISIADCLITNDPNEDYTSRYGSHHMSRFPAGLYQTKGKGFKTHVKTQFLSPLITYTLNLVFYYSDLSGREHGYIGLKYKLEGEVKTSIVYLANPREDGLAMAELYQFTSRGRIIDLEIVIDDHEDHIEVEGILFQPLEVAEHDQVLEDDILHWTGKKDLYPNLLQWFHIDRGQEWFSVDKNGKKCQMMSARAACLVKNKYRTWELSPELRYGKVLLITGGYKFQIICKIKSQVVSPQTTYASYLVYKLPKDQSIFEAPVEVNSKSTCYDDYWYIYLVNPANTPFIGQKLDESTHNPSNRGELSAVAHQRSDGWMEVKIWEFKVWITTKMISMHLKLKHPRHENLCGLSIGGIELRPI